MEFEKYFSEFISHLSEGILVLDDRMNVIMRNRSAERILGIKISHKGKAGIEEIIGPGNNEVLKLISNTCIACATYKTHEIAYTRRSRTIRIQLTMHTQMRKNTSKGFYFFIIISDITEVWKLQNKERRLRSQLQKHYLNQMENLRQIAQSVAHEVRNPIVSIGGYANFILKKYNPAKHGAEEYKKYLSYIRDDVDRLFEIVSQVEKYSDISQIKLKEENTIRIIREALKFGKRFAVRRSSLMDVPDIDVKEYYIFIDSVKIKKVLHNLLKYAVILSTGESPVQVRIKLDQFEFSFTVTFQTGIPREEVPFLFNPFYSTRKQQLNFDLAASQRIVILHGGIITTEWNPENFLTIRLSMPKEKRLERA